MCKTSVSESAVCSQHLTAQQAAALRYQGLLPGQGMPMAQQPYAYSHMGMGGMYGAPQQQLQYGAPYGGQAGVGLPHQHQAVPYTGPQVLFQRQPRKRLSITNPDTGQEVPMPSPAGPPPAQQPVTVDNARTLFPRSCTVPIDKACVHLVS